MSRTDIQTELTSETKTQKRPSRQTDLKLPTAFERFQSIIPEELINFTNSCVKETANSKIIPSDSLEIRNQLIDWLFVVTHLLNQTDATLFLAIDLMDVVYQSYNYKLSQSDLHLITMAALFIASKYEEIKPIRLGCLLSQIGHGKFSKQQVLSAEMLILSKIHFKIPRNHFMDFINIAYNMNKEVVETEEYSNLVLSYAKSFYKLILLNYNVARAGSMSLIYSGILCYAITEANKIYGPKRNLSMTRFWHICSTYDNSTYDLMRVVNGIKNEKTLIETGDKTDYPFYSQYELGKYKQMQSCK